LKRFQLSKNEWELLEKLFPLSEVRYYLSWCTIVWCMFAGISDRDEANVTK
jgi:hypothetical protein